MSIESNSIPDCVVYSDLTVLGAQNHRAIDMVEDRLNIRQVLCYSEFRACAIIREIILKFIYLSIVLAFYSFSFDMSEFYDVLILRQGSKKTLTAVA